MLFGDRYKALEMLVLLDKPTLKKSREALEVGIAISDGWGCVGTAVSVWEYGHGCSGPAFFFFE